MLAKMRRAWRSVPPQAYAQRKAEHRSALGRLAAEWRVSEADLQYLDRLRSPSVLKEPSTLRWRAFRWVIGHGLFYPLVSLLLALIAVGGILVAARVISPLLPVFVRWLFWGAWIDTPVGQIVFSILSVLRWLMLPFLVIAVVCFAKWLFAAENKRGPGYLVQRAREICERLRVQYVIMGHTHDTDLQSIGENGQEYFNTGTWTKVFSEEQRLIREENELAFVQALRQGDGFKVKLLKWDDETGQPRLVKLFD
jgi:hypothetical protein